MHCQNGVRDWITVVDWDDMGHLVLSISTFVQYTVQRFWMVYMGWKTFGIALFEASTPNVIPYYPPTWCHISPQTDHDEMDSVSLCFYCLILVYSNILMYFAHLCLEDHVPCLTCAIFRSSQPRRHQTRREGSHATTPWKRPDLKSLDNCEHSQIQFMSIQ